MTTKQISIGFAAPLVIGNHHNFVSNRYHLSTRNEQWSSKCIDDKIIFRKQCMHESIEMSKNRNERSNNVWLSRRQILLQAPVIGTMLSLANLKNITPLLSESGNMHAELSELASKIPGAGMPDVYFPSYFQGEWLVSRELYAIELAEGNDPFPEAPGHLMFSHRGVEHLRDKIGRRQQFSVRFIENNGHVIEDRLYNSRGEFHDDANGAHIDVRWDKNNPNILSVSWGRAAGKRLRESKITKRAFTNGPQGYGTFVSSEYARVVDVEGEGGLVGFGSPPSIFGRRRIIRYRVSSVTDGNEPDGIDRIVVDYVYPPSPPGVKAVLVLKYRDFLNRK